MSSLNRVKRGINPHNPIFGIVSANKVGKTWFMSQMPKVLIIDFDEGADDYDCDSWHPQTIEGDPAEGTRRVSALDDLYNTLEVIEQDAAVGTCEYSSICVDTYDKMKSFLEKQICARDNKRDISSYGYGTGITALQAEIDKVFIVLKRLNRKYDMLVAVGMQADIKTERPPDTEAYNVHTLALKPRFALLATSFTDMNMHIVRNLLIDEKERKATAMKFNKIIVDGQNAAFKVGNRYGIKKTFKMDDEAFRNVYNSIVESYTAKGVDFKAVLKERYQARKGSGSTTKQAA